MFSNKYLLIITILTVFGVASPAQSSDCSKYWREVDWKIVPFIDLNARYFSYQFKIPAGQRLQFKIKGSFPVSRYMSFHIYDQVTENPISHITDYAITPLPGSDNPFQAGVDRYSTRRNYILEIEQSDKNRLDKTGLWVPWDPHHDQYIDLWYRVYANEESKIALPTIEAYNEQGIELTCPPQHEKEWSIATEPGPLDTRIPTLEQENKIPIPFKSGDVHFFKASTESLGANNDNRYLSTRLDGKALFSPWTVKGRLERKLLKKYNVINNIGNVTVLKFKIPTFPDTLKKLKYFSGEEDVRYWSVCVSGADTRTEDCLMDSKITTFVENGEKYAVMIIGPEALRKKAKSYGFNFLTHETVRAPIVFFRQMLANPTFDGDILKVKSLPKELDPSAAISEDFFGESAIAQYSPSGRQCWFDETFFHTLCGFKH